MSATAEFQEQLDMPLLRVGVLPSLLRCEDLPAETKDDAGHRVRTLLVPIVGGIHLDPRQAGDVPQFLGDLFNRLWKVQCLQGFQLANR